ncbi:hypothetical protein OFO11_35255, partial [Escherichia coli]|nr:hypothetical protein [Escherichia coli]
MLGLVRLDERVPHPDCLAKYAAAFLRNTFLDWLQCEAKARGAPLELLDDAFSVPLLVLVGSRVLVLHAEAHRAVE